MCDTSTSTCSTPASTEGEGSSSEGEGSSSEEDNSSSQEDSSSQSDEPNKSSSSKSSSSKLAPKSLAGIVIGVLAGVGLLVSGVLYKCCGCFRKKNKNPSVDASPQEASSGSEAGKGFTAQVIEVSSHLK